MSQEKVKKITIGGEKIYLKIAKELRKKYPANYYVAIETQTGQYFVGNDSMQVLKEARKKFQIGRAHV